MFFSQNKRINELKSINSMLMELSKFYLNRSLIQDNHQFEFLVFSKNRPIQLFCLLETLQARSKGKYTVHVLYRAEGNRMKLAYDQLRADPFLAGVHFIEEVSFRNQLIDIIDRMHGSRVLFFTDDAYITSEWNVESMASINPLDAVFSLRHGKNLTYSFPYAVEQAIPELRKMENAHTDALFTFDWQSQELKSDWSYPLSVDGHMFLRDELLLVLKNCSYATPNTLEGAMQLLYPVYAVRKGVCFEYSKLSHVHCNRVQEDFQNRFTGKHSVESLLEQWEASMKIDIGELWGESDPALERVFSFCKR